MDNNKPQFSEPLDLQSPVFKPRPGWGGKLNDWLKHNFETKILPILSIGVIVLVAYLYLTKHQVAQVPVQEQEVAQTIEKTVQPGQGLTQVVRSAISDYLNKNVVDVSATQKLYAESYIVSHMDRKPLSVGETLIFNIDDISQVLEKARNLNESELKAWSKYVR